MNLRDEVIKLINEIGTSQITPSAYDTAWVARLAEIGEPVGERALQWLRDNQLEDGSWGAERPLHYHDRAVCTLAAIIALTHSNRSQDKELAEKGIGAFKNAISNLHLDQYETLGFENVIPTLLIEAQDLGLIKKPKSRLLQRYIQRRSAKLEKLPRGTINRHVTAAFSAEMVGPNGSQWLDLANLRENNGSVAYNLAATAYFARYIKSHDLAAINYIEQFAVDGAVPFSAPIDVFERGWILWNLLLSEGADNEVMELCEPHVRSLNSSWIPNKGIAPVGGFTIIDGDTTSIVHEVLTRLNRNPDLNSLLRFEDENHFRCYDFESNESVSTNIHILSALIASRLPITHLSVQKALSFLQNTKTEGGFWFDKWHVSPYYPTSHLIMACTGYCPELIHKSVSWIIDTQKSDGSWGYYVSTPEETAYSLQALLKWRRNGGRVSTSLLEKGVQWLRANMADEPIPLWIGKSLYSPKLVVYSAVLGALMAYDSEFRKSYSRGANLPSN